VKIDCQAYFTSIPHRQLLKLITKRSADGSRLKLIKQHARWASRPETQARHGEEGALWQSSLHDQ
jgi:hypothetical protein